MIKFKIYTTEKSGFSLQLVSYKINSGSGLGLRLGICSKNNSLSARILGFTSLPRVCSDLVVKCQEGDRRVNSLSRLGTKTDDLEPSAMDLFCELVYCNVTGSTHQDLTGGGGGGGLYILLVHCSMSLTAICALRLPPSSSSLFPPLIFLTSLQL